MVGCEICSDFVVADGRQVDEKSENASSQEIPKTYCDEKPNGPFVRVSSVCYRGSSGAYKGPSLKREYNNGMTSMAEKVAPKAMCAAGVPLK